MSKIFLTIMKSAPISVNSSLLLIDLYCQFLRRTVSMDRRRWSFIMRMDSFTTARTPSPTACPGSTSTGWATPGSRTTWTPWAWTWPPTSVRTLTSHPAYNNPNFESRLHFNVVHFPEDKRNLTALLFLLIYLTELSSSCLDLLKIVTTSGVYLNKNYFN